MVRRGHGLVLVSALLIAMVFALSVHGSVLRYPRVERVDEVLPGFIQVRLVKVVRAEVLPDQAYLLITMYEPIPRRQVVLTLKVFLNSDENVSTGDPSNSGADSLLQISRRISSDDVGRSFLAQLVPYVEGRYRSDLRVEVTCILANSTTLAFTLPEETLGTLDPEKVITTVYVAVMFELSYKR